MPAPAAALDRHVADGHPVLHRQRLDRRAGVLDRVAGHAADAEPADRREDQVLRGHAGAELARVDDPHRLRPPLAPGICVASTCSTSDVPIPNASAPKAPCVEVWLSPQTIVMPGWVTPELGADHVDDALAVGAERVDRDAELLAVSLERLDLHARELVGDQVGRRRAVGRHVVVGGRDGLVGPADLAARRGAGRRRPAARSPRGRGAGRCRSGPSATSCASQILSNMRFRHHLAPLAQSGGDHGQELGSARRRRSRSGAEGRRRR